MSRRSSGALGRKNIVQELREELLAPRLLFYGASNLTQSQQTHATWGAAPKDIKFIKITHAGSLMRGDTDLAESRRM